MVFLLRFSTTPGSAQSALQFQYKTGQVHGYIKNTHTAAAIMHDYILSNI